MKIGIIYMAIGIYEEFWKEFYPSCECFFCADAEKGYEVFTDSENLMEMKLRNVTWHKVRNRGFIYNVSAKSSFICSISEKLEREYEAVFFLNGNFKFVAPVCMDEVLPDEENDGLTALSFSHYRERNPNELPYDRNPDCQAYIPFDHGTRYYQGGLYGGRTKEVIRMSEWIRNRIDADLGKKIIARWHDESYVNRYLLDKNPLLLDETYAFVSEIMPFRPHKAVVLDKKKYLGDKLERFKDLSIDNSIAFLLDDKLNVCRQGVVKMRGRLGNQMFQYAFLLYLRNLWKTDSCFSFHPEAGKELLECFPHLTNDRLDRNKYCMMKNANPGQHTRVEEAEMSVFQEIPCPETAVTDYVGYWQCAGYVEAVADEARKAFRWDWDTLDGRTQKLAEEIRNVNSVCVHIRRGDYQNTINKDIYGSVCTQEYYSLAMQTMKRMLADEPVFFLFSDDPDWVKASWEPASGRIVEKEEYGSDGIALYLMTLCRHYIIANSSFSWWGAWLGTYPDKIVISPDRWYSGMPTPDLLPESWFRIPLPVPGIEDCLTGHLFFNLHADDAKDMPCWEQMRRVIIASGLQRKTKNGFLEVLIDKELDGICEGMCNIRNPKELVAVARGMSFLYEKRHISGTPDLIFGEIDASLLKMAEERDERTLFLLPDIAMYLVSRLPFTVRRKEMTNALERIFWYLEQHKKGLRLEERRKIFLLEQKMRENKQGIEGIRELYLHCLDVCDMDELSVQYEVLFGKEEKKDNPTVSVILPVYNTAEWLEECLESLLRQGVENMEVLMIDDGSTDRSSEILEEMQRKDSRFRYIRQENQGLSVARNTGLLQAKGNYIVFLDSDDWLTDNALSILCRRAEETCAEIIAGKTLSVYENGECSGWGNCFHSLFEEREMMSGEDFLIGTVAKGYVPMVYNYIYLREFLQREKHLFVPGLIHEDEVWTPRVMASAVSVAYSDIAHYNYRQRLNSIMTSANPASRIASLGIIIKELKELSVRMTDKGRQAIDIRIKVLEQILDNLKKKQP
ncbi:MAG: glycosyltransferase [Parabacteroides sp.]|nr:glycosyltransferase [Parabacteroides sp.]